MSGPLLTADQREFAAIVRQALGKYDCRRHARSSLDTPQPYPDALHRDLSAIGVFGLTVSGEAGGLDLGLQEAAVVAEQLGAALAPTTFLSGTLAVRLLAGLPASKVAQDLLPGVVGGTSAWGVVLAGGASRVALAGLGGRARASGLIKHVLDGPALAGLLVAVGTGEHTALVALDLTADGVEVCPLVSVDGSRQFAEIRLIDVMVEVLAEGDLAAEVASAVLVDGWVLLAADALGGARECLDVTVEYAANRFQFGRAIGSFQAIKHRLADMLVAVETAESAVRYAAWARDTGLPDAPLAARVAKVVAAEGFLRVATDSVQIHGGNGFTWEFDTHLFLRRARSSLTVLGEPEAVLEDLAALLGLPVHQECQPTPL